MMGQKSIGHLSRTQGALPNWNLHCLSRFLMLLHLQAAAAIGADDDIRGVADHDLLLLCLPPLLLNCPIALIFDFSVPKTTPCSGLKV